MHSLPLFFQLHNCPVILLGIGEAADAKRRILERAGAYIVNEEATAALAIVAIEAEDAAVAAVARLKVRGILVNAVDRPALCDFTLPAIIDRDPLLIAIGTGGASAGLAAALRQRLEALLPASLGALATALFANRSAMKERWPEGRARRQAISTALTTGGALDPLVPQTSDAVSHWLESETVALPNQLITLVLRSHDPDELTLRDARLLAQADCVCHTADVPPAILARARADAARILCETAPTACTHGLCVFITMAQSSI